MMEKNVRKEKATNIHFIEYGLLLARDRNIRLTHYYYHVLYLLLLLCTFLDLIDHPFLLNI